MRIGLICLTGKLRISHYLKNNMRTPDHSDDSRKKVSRGAVGAAQREEKCCEKCETRHWYVPTRGASDCFVGGACPCHKEEVQEKRDTIHKINAMYKGIDADPSSAQFMADALIKPCKDCCCPCHVSLKDEETCPCRFNNVKIVVERNPPEVQESREGDSWDEEFDKEAPYNENYKRILGCCGGDYCIEGHDKYLKDWIRLKKARWEKDSYEKGQDDAFRGRIENMSSIVVKETFEVPEHLREHFRKEARTLALQEAAAIAKGNLWEHTPDTNYDKVWHYNHGREDAAREIENLN